MINYDRPSKTVVDKITDGRFTYGDLITHEWLLDSLNLIPIESGTAQEFKDYQIKLMTELEAVKESLSIDHKMCLRNVRGEGYRILQPSEQTQYVINECGKAIEKAARRAARDLQNINIELLSHTERQENSDAKAKMASVSAFSGKRLELKTTTASQ